MDEGSSSGIKPKGRFFMPRFQKARKEQIEKLYIVSLSNTLFVKI